MSDGANCQRNIFIKHLIKHFCFVRFYAVYTIRDIAGHISKIKFHFIWINVENLSGMCNMYKNSMICLKLCSFLPVEIDLAFWRRCTDYKSQKAISVADKTSREISQSLELPMISLYQYPFKTSDNIIRTRKVSIMRYLCLTHWGRVTHICVSKLTIISSDNGLSPSRRHAIIWTNTEIFLIGPIGTNASEILIGISTFSFKKMHLKMSFGKWRPSYLGIDVLKLYNHSEICQVFWQHCCLVTW